MNKLFYGDNLDIMRTMGQNTVDLIYLDPPFNSQQNYNLLYKTLTGRPVPELAEAFCDTWSMEDPKKEDLLRELPKLLAEHGVGDYFIQFWSGLMQTLRQTNPQLLAYLIYMIERLVYLKVILKPSGSIYLHCDPTASHYIKIMMDGIFGHKNFRNEVIWRRTNAHNKLSKQYGPIHDVLLFYSGSDKFYFNPGKTPYTKAYIEDRFKYTDSHGRYQTNYLTGPETRKGESGDEWRGFNPTANGRHWAIPKGLRQFLPDEGKGMKTMECLEALLNQDLILFPKKKGGQPMYKQYIGDGVPYQDIWAYQPNTKGVLIKEDMCIDEDVKYLEDEDERMGYPTQKPIGLLKRIITTSSKSDEVVFDPFCGCGTTVYAAQQTGRQWIGCDIAILSVRLIRETLSGPKYGLTEGIEFEVDGIPASVEQAKELFHRDPFQFEHWFVERVGGFPTRKTGDRGIDGKIWFDTFDELKSMILSVKGGEALTPAMVRDLRGTVADEENAELGGFLSMEEPTRGMREAAARAGRFEYKGVFYDRIQFLTVKDVIEDHKDFHTPSKVATRLATKQRSIAYDDYLTVR